MSYVYYLRGSFTIYNQKNNILRLSKNSINLISKYNLENFNNSLISEELFWEDMKNNVDYYDIQMKENINNPFDYINNKYDYNVIDYVKFNNNNYLNLKNVYFDDDKKDVENVLLYLKSNSDYLYSCAALNF